MSNIEPELFMVENDCVGETDRGVCDYEGVCENIGRCVLADPELVDAIEETVSRKSIIALAEGYNLGYEKALEEGAVDPLTGFYNRSNLEKLAATFVERAHSSDDSHMVVVFADLDNFKRLNDGFMRGDGTVVPPSHERGDAALRAWAKSTEDFMRSGDNHRNPDVLLRLAGDEFVLLLSANIAPHIDDINPADFDDMQAYQAARNNYAEELMREALGERLGAVPFSYDGEDYIVGASVGIRAIEMPTDTDVQQIIAEVDREMYEHKRARREAQDLEHQAEVARLHKSRLDEAVQPSENGTSPSFS